MAKNQASDVTAATTPAQTPSGLHVFLHQTVNTLLDLVFPHSCLSCGKIDEQWCPRCMSSLIATPLELIERPFLGDVRGYVVATGLHEAILRQAVHALKYNHVELIVRPLAQRLTHALAELEWQPDVIIPVPLHHQRLQERGYNQAGLIAKALAAEYGLPCWQHALKRVRHTRTQVGLTQSERRLNMRDAFKCAKSTKIPHPITNRVILLVDDVYTTGATLSACAAVLQATGAKHIYGLTLTSAFR
jgi:ComF family protein